MIGDRLSGKVLNTKLITDVEDIMLEAYELPDGWVDIGVFTTELDGIGYAAADDATKKPTSTSCRSQPVTEPAARRETARFSV